MNAFLIELDNKPGALAAIGEALAAQNVNITSMAGITSGGSGRVIMTTDNDTVTRAALGEAPCQFDERELITAAIPNVPGTMAKAARMLGDAGINIEAVLPLGMQGNDITVGIVTNQPSRTREMVSQVSGAMA